MLARSTTSTKSVEPAVTTALTTTTPSTPSTYDPLADPYGFYVDDYGLIIGPVLSAAKVAIDTLETKLAQAKLDLEFLHQQANHAKDRGELDQALPPPPVAVPPDPTPVPPPPPPPPPVTVPPPVTTP